MIVCYDSLPSTHQFIKEKTKQTPALFPHGTMIIARTQTAGRGCGDHTFFSPPGGLYLSLLLSEQLPGPEDFPLTPRVAIALCRCVERYSPAPGIKWVNDLFRDKKKLAGILLEQLRVSPINRNRMPLIVSLGLNLVQKEAFPEHLKHRAAYCFQDSAHSPRPVKFAEEIFLEIQKVVQEDPELLLREYHERSILLGQEVCFSGERGTVLGFTKLGQIRIVSNHKEQVLSSGHVSLIS